MKFCDQHWQDLRQAIEDRGLSGFVASSGKEAAEEIKEKIEGTDDETKPYDPLMFANLAIWVRALECGGLYLTTGDYCPLCELEKHSPAKASDWVMPCCDSILEDFRKNGWVPVVQ